MKITSFAICLAAMALVVVAEAAPGSVGSHFRARMIRDKALLQRRDQDTCLTAKNEAIAKMFALNGSIQGYKDSSVTQAVHDFETAINDANRDRTPASYEKIKTAYNNAMIALAGKDVNGTDKVKAATEAMMVAVDKAASACKP